MERKPRKSAAPSTPLAQLEAESDTFSSRFVRVCAATIAVLALVVAVLSALASDLSIAIAGSIASIVCTACYVLSFRANALARRLFVYGVLIAAGGSAASGNHYTSSTYAALAAFLMTVAGFTLGTYDLAITAVLGEALVIGMMVKSIKPGEWGPEAATALAGTSGLLVALAVATALFTSNARKNQRRLHAFVGEVDQAMARTLRIAQGDLAGEVDGDGEMSDALRTMLDGLRTTVTRARETAAALASSALEIATMARQQEQGAVEQATSVTEVHRTLAVLVSGSNQAAQSTEEVFRSVELTHRTSEMVSQRAVALTAQTKRISAILEIIKGIANKSEILALNAALEGARAGEAGRGFSLVATQMQRLAESVMDSIRDVHALVSDIEAASAAMLAATAESTELATRAATAAKQINAALQAQRGSTEQVASAMTDIQLVATQVSAGSTQSLQATRDLTRLAEELKRAIEGFKL